MPIEIKELVVKATLGEIEQSSNSTNSDNGNIEDNKASIINECVEKVLQILKDKLER